MNKRLIPLITIAAFAGIAVVMAVWSDGVCEDDDLLHYLVARAVWRNPVMALDVWGRPGFTLVHAAVAHLGDAAEGFRIARLWTVAVTMGMVTLTWLAARRLRAPGSGLVPLILMLMPDVFGQSFTPCTESVAELYAAAGMYLLLLGRVRVAAIVLALLPVTRHEMIALVVPLGVWFLWRREWVAAALLSWAEVAWNIASVLAGRGLPIHRYAAGEDSSGVFGAGSPLHFVFKWMEMLGAPMTALAAAGMCGILIHQWRWSRRDREQGTGNREQGTGNREQGTREQGTREEGKREEGKREEGWERDVVFSVQFSVFSGEPRRRGGREGGRVSERVRGVRLLIALGAGGLVGAETMLFCFNRFASGGYGRFLMPAAPWMAICACYAVGAIVGARKGRPARVALVASGVMFLSMAPYGRFWLPSDLGVLRPMLAVALLMVGLLPRRVVVNIALGCLVVTAGEQWAPFVKPWRILPHQAIFQSAVASIRARYPEAVIVGQNPWLNYFDERPVIDDYAHEEVIWEAPYGGGGRPLFYLFDGAREGVTPIESIIGQPHELYEAMDVPDVKERPYLRIYRRLP